MIISCCICCDILLPDNVLLHLRCGHIFHENCLTEWMKRSKTCPQCRKKTFKPTRVYPNFTTTCMDELTGQLIQSEKDRYRLKLAAKEVDIAFMEAQMKVSTDNNTKVIHDLRSEIIIFEERIKDMLFEISAAKLMERENVDKLEQCRLELKNAQIDLNGRIKLIECFERVNSQLQARQNEIEVENNRLKEQVRTLLLSATTAIKRKVAMDEFINQHQASKKIVIDLELDDDASDDDCVIVANNEIC